MPDSDLVQLPSGCHGLHLDRLSYPVLDAAAVPRHLLYMIQTNGRHVLAGHTFYCARKHEEPSSETATNLKK